MKKEYEVVFGNGMSLTRHSNGYYRTIRKFKTKSEAEKFIKNKVLSCLLFIREIKHK